MCACAVIYVRGCPYMLLVVQSRLSCLLLCALCIEVLSAVASQLYRVVWPIRASLLCDVVILC